MKPNHKLFVSIILTLALVIALLNAAGVFDNSQIVLTKSEYTDEIDVYIVGEINNPGIYRIKKGSILNDIVKLAGGLTEKTDEYSINLAYKIDKNMMIKIQDTTMIKLDDTLGIAIYDESMSSVMVNINTADVAQLCEIPGVGEATARTIIEYRAEHGRFKTIYDIMNVTGIKDAKFESMRDFICTE